MRILVTGSHGQLGSELRRCFESMKAEIGSIPVEYKDAVVDYIDYDTLDIANSKTVQMWFAKHKPYDLVINCAAATNVDGCEKDESTARAVNAQGARNLAVASQRQGAKIVHVSTDYVFSGTEAGERIESDKTGPLSAYGRTKLEGEQFVVAANPHHFIVRTAWLYGYVGGNFVKTMRRLAETHSQVSVVKDQVGNPTSANDLAYEILKLALTNNFGTYHCTNKGTCSWADFAIAIMKESKLDCEVIPVTSVEYKSMNPQSADRPAFSSLRNKHLEDTIGDEMRPWREALAMYLSRLPELEE